MIRFFSSGGRSWPVAFALVLLAAVSVQAELDPARLESWKLPAANLHAVTTRGQNAWAGGYWGTILRSTDRGRTWTQADTPTANTLFGVSFADENTGWAVGANGTILRSSDGGVSWKLQLATVEDEAGEKRPLATNLFGVAALSPTQAFVVGDLGVVLRTRDGESWEALKFDAERYADEYATGRLLNAVVFTSPTDGWIAGEFATLMRTRDGGETWVGQREIRGATDDLYLFDLAASGAGPAAAVGLAGSVLVSNETGDTWESRSVETTAGLFGIAWSSGSIVAIGDRGVIFISRDAGRTWSEASHPPLFNWLSQAAFASPNEAIIVGERGVILRSEDGGGSWTAAVIATTALQPPVSGFGGTPAPAKAR